PALGPAGAKGEAGTPGRRPPADAEREHQGEGPRPRRREVRPAQRPHTEDTCAHRARAREDLEAAASAAGGLPLPEGGNHAGALHGAPGLSACRVRERDLQGEQVREALALLVPLLAKGPDRGSRARKEA